MWCVNFLMKHLLGEEGVLSVCRVLPKSKSKSKRAEEREKESVNACWRKVCREFVKHYSFFGVYGIMFINVFSRDSVSIATSSLLVMSPLLTHIHISLFLSLLLLISHVILLPLNSISNGFLIWKLLELDL